MHTKSSPPHSFHDSFQQFHSSGFHLTHSFMEMNMIITRRNSKEEDGKLMTLVKSAAWAWFQHGSGSKMNSFQVFQLTRHEKVVAPSRFKLEARRVVMENNGSLSESSESSEYLSSTVSPVRTDTSLFDAYEVEQISRELEFLIETCRRRSSFATDQGHKKNTALPKLRTSPESEKKLRKNPKKLNEPWMLRYGAVCRSIDGVVEPRVGAVCRSIEGVVEPVELNRPGRRVQRSRNYQSSRKTQKK